MDAIKIKAKDELQFWVAQITADLYAREACSMDLSPGQFPLPFAQVIDSLQYDALSMQVN